MNRADVPGYLLTLADAFEEAKRELNPMVRGEGHVTITVSAEVAALMVKNLKEAATALMEKTSAA